MIWHHLPHVDQILRQGHRVRITGDGDGPVGVSAVTLLAVRDADHCTGDLADFGDFGTALTDDATDQVVWHCHFMGLGLDLGHAAVVVGSQLGTGQRCESYGRNGRWKGFCLTLGDNSRQNLLA